MLSVDILSVIRNGAAAAMRTLATSTRPIGSIDSPLSSFVTPSLFHSMLITFLLCKSFPPQPSFSSSALTPRISRTITATTAAYYCYCTCSRYMLIADTCVRELTQKSHSLSFPLYSLLFHTIHSKSDYCHTALLSFSLISHHFSLFSSHTQTHQQRVHRHINFCCYRPWKINILGHTLLYRPEHLSKFQGHSSTASYLSQGSLIKTPSEKYASGAILGHVYLDE